MKLFILTYLTLSFSIQITAQINNRWIAYLDEKTELIGYKDENGKVMIEPHFTNFISAKYFNKIIAVAEEVNGSSISYYLTKSGKTLGNDSLYISDNSPDCENEGFIRFKDNKTDLVGMLNSNGEIVVPADYSDLSKAINGFIIALKNARKEYFNENPADEHFSWVDGQFLLIDTTNNIIIENFDCDAIVNFYSLKIEDKIGQDENRNYYLSTDGRYYSFINFEKEFNQWFWSYFIKNISKESLNSYSYHKIYYWIEPDGWIHSSNSEFVDKNFVAMKEVIERLNSDAPDYFISVDGLNPFIFSDPEFEIYFNNCAEPKIWEYPVLSVIINYWSDNDLYQDYFDFLRTDNGYKLISISVGFENRK